MYFWRIFEKLLSTVVENSSNFEPGLLRTLTYWIFEALVPFPKVVADILVFVHDLRGVWATFWDISYKGVSG